MNTCIRTLLSNLKFPFYFPSSFFSEWGTRSLPFPRRRLHLWDMGLPVSLPFALPLGFLLLLLTRPHVAVTRPHVAVLALGVASGTGPGGGSFVVSSGNQTASVVYNCQNTIRWPGTLYVLIRRQYIMSA